MFCCFCCKGAYVSSCGKRSKMRTAMVGALPETPLQQQQDSSTTVIDD
jgi:hypothetical protein